MIVPRPAPGHPSAITAVLTTAATALLTAAQAMGLHVTSSTGKTATVSGIVAGLSTIVHLVAVTAPKLKRKPPVIPQHLTMYDTTTPEAIPADAIAVAAYLNGAWPTLAAVKARFWGKSKIITITVSANEDADCLDVETGDATPDQAPGWVHRQRQQKPHKRPWIYANLSTMAMVIIHLQEAGIRRDHVFLWTAHPTNKRHFCNHRTCGDYLPPGISADGTQYKWETTPNLDTSVCHSSMFQ